MLCCNHQCVLNGKKIPPVIYQQVYEIITFSAAEKRTIPLSYLNEKEGC